ncbi:hypothetical protein S83_035319, partial [Arachis hypogaea]
MHFSATVFIASVLILFTFSCVHYFYLPGVAPQDFQTKSQVHFSLMCCLVDVFFSSISPQPCSTCGSTLCIIHHYPSIFKAISPHYIFHFFWRNGKVGWLLLSGTVFCIT